MLKIIKPINKALTVERNGKIIPTPSFHAEIDIDSITVILRGEYITKDIFLRLETQNGFIIEAESGKMEKAYAKFRGQRVPVQNIIYEADGKERFADIILSFADPLEENTVLPHHANDQRTLPGTEGSRDG